MYQKDEEKDINLLITRVKKNPTLFKDRILQKLNEFIRYFDEVKRDPGRKHPDFCGMCLFFAQIFEFYPSELHFVLESLMQLFEHNGELLNAGIRYKIIQSLIIIKKKGYIDFLKSFEFFSNIFGLQDKPLRKLVFHHLINHISNMSKKKLLAKIETPFLMLLQRVFDNASPEILRRLIKVFIKLYYKTIWTSPKIVNLIASRITTKDQKITLLIAKFLINTTEQIFKEEDLEKEEESMAELTKEYSNKFKQSKKKIEKLERQIKNIKKKERRIEKLAATSNIYPIDMLYNSTNFVEQIMSKLMKEKNLKFALKTELMCLLGRIIGRNKLIYPNYYNYVIRFVRPEIKTPARLFAFIAESVHENSSIQDVELLCKRVIENFVADGFTEEKITMGINMLRLILMRNEFAMNPEDLNYVCKFRSYKNKSVSTAAKAFINVARDLCPDNLEKEFHVYNRQGDLDVTVKKKGSHVDRIDGAELLNQDRKMPVEYERILTDEDFKLIKKLKRQKIMEKLKAQEDEENQPRAIHMPDVDVLALRDRMIAARSMKVNDMTEQEIQELINNPDYADLINELQLDQEDEDESEDQEEFEDESEIGDESEYGSIDEDDEDSEEIDEDEIEMEDDGEEENEVEEDDEESEEESKANKKSNGKQKQDPKNAKKPSASLTKQIDEEMEIESDEDEDEDEDEIDDEELLEDEEDLEMKRRGFITATMIDTFKKKNRISDPKAKEHFQEMLEKKYVNRKKQKRGSKTNKEKLKNKPIQMVMNKIQKEKSQMRQVSKRIKKSKNFVGKANKFDKNRKRRSN